MAKMCTETQLRDKWKRIENEEFPDSKGPYGYEKRLSRLHRKSYEGFLQGRTPIQLFDLSRRYRK